MGVVKNIRWNKFPSQNVHTSNNIGVGTNVEVVFDYDTTHRVYGVIVRDDNEEPHKSIIALDDGRFILASECQYTPVATNGCYVDAGCKFNIWEHLDVKGITATFNISKGPEGR